MRATAIIAALVWSMLAAVPASAGPAEDATGFVSKVMDQFNGGDAKAFVAAHEDDALIVDEFAPHLWTGAGSVKQWLDAYVKMSAADKISGGRVDYGKPLQATSDGKTAYVVLPTTYRFVQNGAKMAEPSSMTFVLRRKGQDWKIASWTFAGGVAAAEK